MLPRPIKGPFPDIEYSSPNVWTPRQRLTLTVAPPLIGGALKLLSRTCHVDVRRLEGYERAQREHGRVIIAFWHETLLLALWMYRNRGYHTLTSLSFDGELAARACHQFGLYAVRGSSSQGGLAAVRQLEQLLVDHATTVGLTLDGPKGPRRVAKPGAALLAMKTGVPILPCAFAAAPCWRLRSWDRMMVPKPFSRIVCVYGDPVEPAGDDGARNLQRRIQQSLNALHDSLETNREP